jgi:hypothetical protein
MYVICFFNKKNVVISLNKQLSEMDLGSIVSDEHDGGLSLSLSTLDSKHNRSQTSSPSHQTDDLQKRGDGILLPFNRVSSSSCTRSAYGGVCESNPPGVLDLSRMWKTLDFLAAALAYNELTVTSGFRAFDQDGDGRVSIEDLRQSMHDLEQTMQPCELQILFNFIDTDRDGLISETEWSTALRHAVPFSTPSRLQVLLDAEASMMQTIECFTSPEPEMELSSVRQQMSRVASRGYTAVPLGHDRRLVPAANEPPAIIRYYEVPGPERVVRVPGPERIVEKIVEKTVEVPGPERVVEVPGPERIVYVDRVVESAASTIKAAEVQVERTVEKIEVPGPERIVEVPGPERIVYTDKIVEKIVEVPGPERIVEKIVEKTVEVPGPERVVEVPGPERIVYTEKVVEKTVEVPGPERVVEVLGPERIVYVDRVVESAASTIKAAEVKVERIVEKIEVPGPERIVEVPGPERIVYTEKIVEKIVEVPGPERIVEKIVEKTVEVPGPERVVEVPGPERIVYTEKVVEKTVEVPGPERVVEVPGPERIVYVDRVVESAASTIKTTEVEVERKVEKIMHDNVNRCASLERVDTLERKFDLAFEEIVNLRSDLKSIRPCSYRSRPVSRSVVWPLCGRVGLPQRETEREKRDNPMVLSRCQKPWCPCRRDYSDLIARNPDNPVSIILHNHDVIRPSSCTTLSKLASLYGKPYTLRPHTKRSGDSATRLYFEGNACSKPLFPSLSIAGLRNPREWKQSQETQQMSVSF